MVTQGLTAHERNMYGTCDVPGCSDETYMGWAPIGEQKGKQICEYHFRRHDDPADNFNLFDVFGFRKPAGMNRPIIQAEPKTKEQLHDQLKAKSEKSVPRPESIHDKMPRCRICGGVREAGHTYCQSCAAERKRHTHQERQRRYRQRQAQTAKA